MPMGGVNAVANGTVLRFVPHAKFRFDEVRQAWIILAPERLLLPDAQAVAVLKLIDGARTADTIIETLSHQYEVPREIVAGDVLAMLQDLVDKKVLRE